MTTSSTVSVIVIGCGCPLRSMGWYHAEQLLAGRCPSAQIVAIVEPFFMQQQSLSYGSSAVSGYSEFHTWRKEKETKDGIQFYCSVQDLPPIRDGEIRMGIISARTADNPSLFAKCIQSPNCNFHTLFLEKPGASTVTELIYMRDMAKDAGVNVYMGFNKNVSSYVDRTRQFVATADPGQKLDVTFHHNNAYKKEELPECFERNNEGMLKNMAIHELAILVTYYNVTVETVESVIADQVYSSCQTLCGPSSGIDYTDFDKIKFQIKTKAGIEINIAADRCGGNDSIGIIRDNHTGMELIRFTMPDDETISTIPSLEQLYPGAMPYFFTQDPDYCTLKERIANACLDGTTKPNGVATIDTGIATLQLAEYLTPLLQEQLLSSTS
jgi:predicted dehydrogenase